MERDKTAILNNIPAEHFNSHAHVERDGSSTECYSDVLDFNSHAHVERDNRPAVVLTAVKHFNSHAHVERDAPALLRYVHGGYFNSHAHVERDTLRRVLNENVLISTHTLTWSVTNMVYYNHRQEIFQLTRSRGA